jgi:hypothetical protein
MANGTGDPTVLPDTAANPRSRAVGARAQVLIEDGRRAHTHSLQLDDLKPVEDCDAIGG